MDKKGDKKESEDSDLELIKAQWAFEQLNLCSEIVETDSEQLGKDPSLFGGLDISFIIGDDTNACACFVIVNDKFEVVYKDLKMVEMTAPYIPGYLAFREAGSLSQMVKKQIKENPELTPNVLMVDGNGILHPRQCGTACHIALATGLPTVGVAKNLHLVDQFGGDFSRDVIKNKFANLTDAGDNFSLTTSDGKVLGAALKASASSKNPIYVSVGSGIALATAISLVIKMSRHRVPEPIRQADMLSREFLRLNHPTERQIQAVKNPGRTKQQKLKEAQDK